MSVDRWLTVLRQRLRSAAFGRALDRELDDELRYHIEQAIRAGVAEGLTPEVAERRARLALGGVQQRKEECRDMRGLSFLESCWRDLSLSARWLWRSPAFTAVAVTSLALGIGINTLMFSVMNAVVFEPLPFPDADRLVRIYMASSESPAGRGQLPPPMYFLLRDRSESFEAVGVYDNGRPLSLAGDTDGATAEQLNGHRISATAFQALGTQPLLGRYHTLDEDLSGSPRTVVLGHRLWERRFGARPNVVGETVVIDGQSTQIIGVMPPDFELFDGNAEAWVGFGFAPAAAVGSQHWLSAIGRLKPNVSIEQATAEIQAMAAEYTRTFPNRGEWVLHLEPAHEAYFGSMRRPLVTLQAAVAFVLLISCANLAALLLTRAAGRQRELAVRASLGQGRGGIIRQLLVESLLLSFVGGAVGALITWAGLAPLRALTPQWFPRLETIGFDLRVFGFSAAVCVITGVIFGLVPALRVSRTNLVSALHDASGRSSAGPKRLLQLHGLVAVQVALAFVLLIGAGLMIHSFVKLQRSDFGVDTDRLLTLEVYLQRAQFMTAGTGQVGGISLVDYHATGPQLFDRIHTALLALPGVEHAAGTMFLPFRGTGGIDFRIDGRVPDPESQGTFAGYTMVTPGYFRTIQLPLVLGRDFAETDQLTTPWVVVINEAMARQYWPDQNPIGERITFSFYEGNPEQPREVIGVVSDRAEYRGMTEAFPTVYALHRQQLVQQRASIEGQRLRMGYVLRTTGDPMALAADVRNAIARIDPAQPVASIRTVSSYLDDDVQQPRFIATLFGIFGVVALAIGAVGIYGVTSHTVALRHREFGIRRALGAPGPSVVRLVLRRAMLVVAIGVAVGIGSALLLTRFIQTFLWDVSTSDPVTFVTIASLLLLTGLVACLIPSLRAARVDPIVVLRHE